MAWDRRIENEEDVHERENLVNVADAIFGKESDIANEYFLERREFLYGSDE